MSNGLPDTVRAQALFGELIQKGVAAASTMRPRVAVYGECVQLLWEQGNAEAAIQMEKVGNELIKSYDIDILCGYSLNGFQGQPGTEMFQRVCDEHSAVYCG